MPFVVLLRIRKGISAPSGKHTFPIPALLSIIKVSIMNLIYQSKPDFIKLIYKNPNISGIMKLIYDLWNLFSKV